MTPKYLCRTLALCGAIFSICLPPAYAASFPSGTFPDGVGVNTGFQFSLTSQDVQKLQDAGIQYLRIDLKWSDRETAPGVYNWTQIDALKTQMKAAGFKPVFLLSYYNPLYGSDGLTMNEPSEHQGFANFAAAAVARYDHEFQGAIWELWNEPNTMKMWAASQAVNSDSMGRERAVAYMGFINTVVPAMRTARPGCTIISGGLLDIGWSMSMAWFDECFSRGLLTKVDALGAHLYGETTGNRYPERIEGELANLRALITSYGGSPSFPILNTEFGIEPGEFSGEASTLAAQEQLRAASYVRMCLLTRRYNVLMNVWYHWRGDQSYTLLQSNYTAKPAYNAINTMSDELVGYTYERSEMLGAPGDYALVFKNGTNRKVVVWTTSTARTAAIPVLGGTTFPIVSMLGTSSSASVTSGHINVGISGEPTYINLGTGDLGPMASDSLATQDIGGVDYPGFSGSAAGTYWVRASGADIWGTADEFRFVYQPLTGNGSITARVTGLTNTSATAKAGVMMRESLLPGARHISYFATPSGQAQFLRRMTANSSTTATVGASGSNAMPHWVRITRNGDDFTSYLSSDNGATWQAWQTVSVVLPGTIYIGLAVTSNKYNQLATGVFDNVTPNLVQHSGPPPNGAAFNAFNRIEAESRTTQAGTGVYSGGSGQKVGSIENNTWLGFSGVDFGAGAGSVSARLASNSAGGNVEFRLGSTSGALLGTATVPGTGGWNNFVDVQAPITGSATGMQDLYLVFKGAGTSALLDIDYFQFAEPEFTLTSAAIGGAAAGTAAELNGTYTIEGGGTGIENGTDQFQYVYTTLTGDGVLTARVTGLENTHTYAKAGLMFRQSLNSDSIHFTSLVHANLSGRFQRRIETGGALVSTGNSYGIPQWLRIQRSGNTFTSYTSSNGTYWSSMGSHVWANAPATMYIGLAVCSRSTQSATATFQNVTFPLD